LHEEPESDEEVGTEEEITTGEEEPDEMAGEPEAEEAEETVPEVVFHPGTDDEAPLAFRGVTLPKTGEKPVAPVEEAKVKEGKDEGGGEGEAAVCPLFITITNPANGGVYERVELPVRGRTCPELAVQLFVVLHRLGGDEVLITRARTDGRYEFRRVRFRNGDNSIQVVVADEAGNIAWAESNFKVELDEDNDEGEDDSPCRYSVWLDCPAREAYSVDEEFTCGVNICFPESNLMVYDMRISHDPSVVNIVEASGGDAPEFGSLVINKQNVPAEGGLAVSPFNGVNNGSTMFSSPRGLRINVAQLTFRAVGAGSSRLSLQCVGLWDTNLKPVSPHGSRDALVRVR
ncbi:MAG: hypothetical protein JSU92_03005, partial [Deltaproteobacteria bacterium]